MIQSKTERGFGIVTHPDYTSGNETRLVQESSAIGDYGHSLSIPGSSYLWVGADHHLNRLQVAELIEHMQRWLRTGTLRPGGAALQAGTGDDDARQHMEDSHD